jgi:hypothetical protein
MVDTKNLQNVLDYFQAHKDEIINTYHATGAAVGKANLNDDDYVIVVYLKDKQQEPKESVVIDNIPLKFEVTGVFNLHQKLG